MKREKILKVVSIYENFNREELETNNIGVEIQDFTESNLKDEEFSSIVEFYKKNLDGFKGIKAMHGPFMDLKPASPDNEIKSISIKKYIKTIKAGAEMKMDYIVFHSQINPDLNEDFIIELNSRQNAEAWKLILDSCNEYKGTILLENVFEKDPYILKSLLDEINLPNVKLNLDIGHIKLTKVDLSQWVMVLKEYLVYSHIHTNDGVYDQHRPITREEFDDYMEILRENDIEVIISLEYKLDNIDQELRKLGI